MRLGWPTPAGWIYAFYSTQCHQMAQRSFFLFGRQPMYNIAELPMSITGKTTADILLLRSFIGSPAFGWKVAWSDRMVYMYGSLWLMGMFYGVLRQRRRIRPLHLRIFALLLLPMALDGFTHLLSDGSGLAQGFRYTNQWLANLTANSLGPSFYVGDAVGSFNSWMRFLSGLAFGIGTVWLAFPYLDAAATETAARLREKLTQAGLDNSGIQPVLNELRDG